VTLTGSVWESAGSFCAVTVTVGSVIWGMGGCGAAGVCARATAGTTRDSERAAAGLKRIGLIMQ
jgi:hypothetical protein